MLLLSAESGAEKRSCSLDPRLTIAALPLNPQPGANANIPDFDGRTPLHLALEDQDVELLELLLAGGANPNAKCPDLVSCVHFASQRCVCRDVDGGGKEPGGRGDGAVFDRGALTTTLVPSRLSVYVKK